MTVLKGSNNYIMASGNTNEFGIMNSQRLAPDVHVQRNKAEKGWISKPSFDNSFSEFSLPE